MSRDSVKAADIDGVTLRRISVKDLMEGILMPEEKWRGSSSSGSMRPRRTVTACVRAIS